MRSGFLGFGEMSDEEQSNAMLFVILALSTECVLEGLLSGSSERFWIFHAISAVLSIWGLSSGSSLAMQLASLSGIVNFFNEIELVWEFESRARLITPTFVLLAASVTLGWKVFGSSGKIVNPPQGLAQRVRTRRTSVANFEPYFVFFGAILVVYSLAFSKWFEVESWFGLVSNTVGFGDIRQSYEELNISSDVSSSYLDFGYLISFASAGVGVVVYFGRLTDRYSVSSKVMLLLSVGSFVAMAWHTSFVVDLWNRGGELEVGVSALACVLGLGLISGCAWKSREGL